MPAAAASLDKVAAGASAARGALGRKRSAITVAGSGRKRWRAPNGGWRVSAVDYAKFVQAFDHH